MAAEQQQDGSRAAAEHPWGAHGSFGGGVVEQPPLLTIRKENILKKKLGGAPGEEPWGSTKQNYVFFKKNALGEPKGSNPPPPLPKTIFLKMQKNALGEPKASNPPLHQK